MYTYVPPEFLGYKYPGWAVAMGWMTAAASLVPVPTYFIYYLLTRPGTFMEVNTLVMVVPDRTSTI